MIQDIKPKSALQLFVIIAENLVILLKNVQPVPHVRNATRKAIPPPNVKQYASRLGLSPMLELLTQYVKMKI